jgi:putative chitinase
MTRDELLAILPAARPRVDAFLVHINDACPQYDITTAARMAAFVAQTGHESGSFLYVEEIASGRAYENRADLGNTQPGDGVRFKGRGLIQVTGRANYERCSMALFGDDRLLQFPELLEDPRYAVYSACWFWKQHGLNELADVGNFKRITKIINGGYNGYEARLAIYQRALSKLGSVLAHTSDGHYA